MYFHLMEPVIYEAARLGEGVSSGTAARCFSINMRTKGVSRRSSAESPGLRRFKWM
jgi:hypothetical protein